MKNKNIVLFILSVSLLVSCSFEPSQNEKQKNDDSLTSKEMEDLQDFMFLVPSPLETAFFIKNSGIVFDKEILHQPDKVSNYITSKDKAINLGIFGSDLCFASLYNQSQISLLYLSAISKINVDLNVVKDLNKKAIDEFLRNLSNRDYVAKFISENILDASKTLKQDKKTIGAYIIFGGWIEGAYLLAYHTQKAKNVNNELINNVVEQKYVLENVIKLMEHLEQSSDVIEITADLKLLYTEFEKIKVSQTKATSVYDSTQKQTVLKSATSPAVLPKDLGPLFINLQKLRNKYTK